MNSVLSALRREEKKSLRLISEAEQQLDTVRQAIKLMAGKAIGKATGRKRRRMSAATRKKMAASARKRWAAKKAQ
jgi:hypothetical protein